MLKGALLSLFGLSGTGVTPSCGSDVITVTDSRPHAGVGACAQPDGPGYALAKIVNERPYPIDVLYPVGARIDIPSADPFAQLGEDINNLVSNWHDRALLPGGGEADSTVSLAAGQRTGFVTEFDGEAYLLGILGTAIRLLTKISAGLAVSTPHDMISLLDRANCLREAVSTVRTASLSLATVQAAGSAAFDCVAAVAKGVSDTIFTVASIAASLAVELISSVWGAIDTVGGNAYHEVTLQRLGGSCPSEVTVRSVIQAQPFWGGTAFTVSPNVTCIGPYVSATVTNSSGSGARVILEQESTGLRYLVAGSGPTCTTIRSEVEQGQLIYIPPQYGRALLCLTG